MNEVRNSTPKGAQPSTGQAPAPQGKRATAAAKLNDVRDAAGDYVARAADVVEANPIAVVAGGIAVGLVAGALIPRSEREREALAPLGKKLHEGASAAITAARETGKAQLTASLLSPDAAKESARAVYQSAVDAVRGNSKTDAGEPTGGNRAETQTA